MRIIDITHPPQSLWIGREGENTFRPVSFECANWFSAYPNATIAAYYQPYGASDPYPLVLTVDGTKRIWHPLLAELVKGDGELQIVLMNGDTVGTSAIIPTKVDRSLISNADHPASEAPSWTVQVVQDVTEQADRAEEASEHYPKIISGVWYVWSVSDEDFVSTGISAQGEDGVSPTATVEAIDGGHRVTITDADGAHTFDVMDGEGGSGGGSAENAVLYTPMSLTPAQQGQARENIGAVAKSDLAYVTPEQFGAKGDGETDDTSAIQAALNDGNLILCRDSAVYLVSSSLQISGGTILDLNGSTFHTENDIPIIVENQNNSAVSKIVIRNGYFSGTRSDGDGSSFTNQCGIRIRSFQSVYDNLRFDNFNYGIYLDARSSGSGTLVENRILNSKFANCLDAAIYNETGTKATDGILNNVKIGGTGYDHGVLLKQAGGWQVSNLHVYGSGFTVGAEFRNSDTTLLSNIYIGGNHSMAGLILHDYSHVELSNAVIQANTARTNGLWAQTSTSQRWEKKPILLSNVVFSSNAAAGSEIFAIRGGGDIQTVNVIYNDQFGAFVDSRVEPTEQDPSHVVKEAKVDEFGYNIYYPIDNGKELANNKDFNTIIEPGNYIVTKSAVAQSAVNIPEAANGRLVVSNPVGVNGTNRYLRQEYRTYSTTNAIAYERYGTSSDGGETWSWRPWISVRDSLSTAIPISSGDDLNNYTNPGAWLVRTNTIAQNTANIPVATPGRLFVMDMLNGYARGESSVYLLQFYVPYTTAQGIYSRYGVYSNGAWTWHEWQGYQTAAQVQTAIAAIPDELPAVTASDNGKFLRVVNGAWAAATIPAAESNSFGGGA